MCTLSLIDNDENLIITMNRDESRLRHELNKINCDSSSNIKIYYPVDALSGGTWFGFNENGCVMALLNRYQDNNTMATRSRGEIIPHLLQYQSANAILSSIKHNQFNHYQSFDLLVTDCYVRAKVSWNGQQLFWKKMDKNKPLFMTSSSINLERIRKFRSEEFSQFIKNANHITPELILKNFHLNQHETDTSKSVLMSRKRTHTKSISQIVLNNNQLYYRYYNQQNLHDMICNNLNEEHTLCQEMTLNLNC